MEQVSSLGPAHTQGQKEGPARVKDEGTGSAGCGKTHARRKEGTGKEEPGGIPAFLLTLKSENVTLKAAAAFPNTGDGSLAQILASAPSPALGP